jgi:hypothetical protein
MKFGIKLPVGVLRNDRWQTIRDQDAFLHFNNLVRDAASQLSVLNHDPVAVAASPNRFDDAWNYEWHAVRCGKFFSEEGSYMGKYKLKRDLVAAPVEARSAYGVLVRLEEAAWREMFATAFDIEWTDQSLSAVVQAGLSWLVFSSNNCSDDGDPVFAVWEDQPLSYFGEAKDRFDWAIQDPHPLVFLSGPGEMPAH